MNYLLSALFFLSLFVSCVPTEAEKEKAEDVFVVDPPVGAPSEIPPSETSPDPVVVPPTIPPTAAGCYRDTYTIPEQDISRKVDVIIVPDTSGSIAKERSAVADGIEAFLDAIPGEVDLRVGVILAHATTSSHSGVLYKKGSEPRVLDNQLQNIGQIKTDLRKKMASPAADGASDGGELGMLSLLNSLSEENYASIQAQGLYREDAALVVIFVADEQDICAEYPEGVVPVYDPEKAEPKAYGKFCVKNVGGQDIRLVSPSVVLENLQALRGDTPLVVSGVIYNNTATMPLDGENEIGYGYKELIDLAGGVSVDLANGEYGEGLKKIGRLAQAKIAPMQSFAVNISDLDGQSIHAYVDEIEVPFEYRPDMNIVTLLKERDAFSVVDVTYCEKEKIKREVMQLAAGGFHSCALFTNGDVKCWGQNTHGQLGQGHVNHIGDDEDLIGLSPIVLGEEAIYISAGLYHSCAVLKSFKLRCWGQNSNGQLGLGHTDNIGDNELPTDVSFVSIPGAVERVYSGTRYNCALNSSGDIYCFGENAQGQLGYGHQSSVGDDELPSSAGKVSIGGRAVQMDVSTISSHACAVLSTGSMRCWGLNSSGQLGLGHTQNIGDNELPSSIAAIDFNGRKVRQVATGNAHNCTLLDDNTVNCFGGNFFGQLGRGNQETIGDDELPKNAGAINGEENALFIATGNFSTCMINESFKLKCFGQGSFGKLGHGGIDHLGDNETFAQINYLPLPFEVEAVVAGINHTCTLSKDEGKVACFGQGNFGQLGRGNMNHLGDDETLANLSPIVFE